MGGTDIRPTEEQIRRNREIGDFARHPNVDDAEIPNVQVSNEDFQKIVRWTLNSVCSFISPPKLDDENNEFACENVAAAIRGPLYSRLHARIDNR